MTETIRILLYAAVVLGAAVVQSISGFGFGILSMAVLPYFMPSYADLLVSTGFIGLFICTYRSARKLPLIEWRIVAAPFTAHFVSFWIATKYFSAFSTRGLQGALGAVLIMIGLYSIFGNRIRIKANLWSGLLAGAAAGVINAFFGMGGPPVAIYMAAATVSKEAYLTNLSCLFMLISAQTTLIRLINGLITKNAVLLSAEALPFVVLGMWIGGKFCQRVKRQTMLYLTYGFIMCNGMIMLVRCIWG